MTTVPLAVRVRNARIDQMLTGYLHGGLKFQKADPGGFKSASFVVSKRLGYRSDLIQPYSRIYIYNQRNGDTVFEGDVSHPGRSVDDAGELLEVQVEGGVERLNDWSGARIFIDRDMQAWTKTNNSLTPTTIQAGDDFSGAGFQALNFSFGESVHVATNYRAEAGYFRIREAGQQLGRFNYSFDNGISNASWRIRSITTPPSEVVRDDPASTTFTPASAAEAGISYTAGANVLYLQMLWNSGSSNTGTSGDVVWTSFFDVSVGARLHLRDGSWRTTGYLDGITAVQAWEDMLGDMLTSTFDGPNAVLDTGAGFSIQHLAFPDGITPLQVAEELMKFEPSCTYLVGPSKPGGTKYSLRWLSRTNDVRYEFSTWADDYSASAQPVDQYDEVVTRWKSPSGLIKTTTSSTQSIPEMTAMGRKRRYFQDLSDTVSNELNAAQANAGVLNDHRFPQNGGRVTVARSVVDLFTGRRVQPFEIEPAYLCRIVGINPSRDALNSSPRNGSTLCRIITTDYDADSNSVSIDLDSEPWSMYKAIAKAKPKPTPQRNAF
jgi:hypothetical protein